jgi:uncharacterized small protein (DUF1192 family)
MEQEAIMAFDPDDRPRPKVLVTIEQIALDPLSVEDLGIRIAACRDEIARCEAAIEKKQATRNAAAAFFKN